MKQTHNRLSCRNETVSGCFVWQNSKETPERRTQEPSKNDKKGVQAQGKSALNSSNAQLERLEGNPESFKDFINRNRDHLKTAINQLFHKCWPAPAGIESEEEFNKFVAKQDFFKDPIVVQIKKYYMKEKSAEGRREITDELHGISELGYDMTLSLLESLWKDEK